MNLAKIQFLTLSTKAVTSILGLVQSLIIVRLLDPGLFGLVGLVVSIGSVIGVSQHLGIVDGAIREIAVRKKKEEIGKVFWVSHIVRQALTLPLSTALMALAGIIATRLYGRPEIAPYIQIFAASLILQGFQDVLGATLTGMKRFVPLYMVQIITAVINIAVFGLLTWKFGVAGFFWAIILTTSIMVILFAAIIARDLRGHLSFPSKQDIQKYGRSLMRIGVFMYVSRIFFVMWQRLPLLILGGVLVADELGYLNAALAFGSKLVIVTMALSEVNLSWMSSLYVNKKEQFAHIATRNTQQVLVLMLLMTLVLLFFVPEVLTYVNPEYLPAYPVILLMTGAFFLYGLIDIGTISVFVPANNPKLRSWIFGILTVVSGAIIGWLYVVRPDSQLAAAGMLFGTTVAYVTMIVIARLRYKISLISFQLGILLAALGISIWWLETQPSLLWRIAAFFVLCAYVIWEAYRHKLVPEQFTRILRLKKKNIVATSYELPITNYQLRIVCFAGAEYDLPSWTNRQHVMSRIAEQHPVLYVEPRVWILRYMTRNWRHPGRILRYFKRLFWYEKKGDQLYVKSQWNLLPGSRENRAISWFNHMLNRRCVLLTARWLGFRSHKLALWLYDTEAAEYLLAFKKATVLYDCVDDHAAQAGVDRNPQRVEKEEKQILQRADLVTVTSKKLFSLKSSSNQNTHLVLNAGDVELYSKPKTSKNLPFDFTQGRPVFGSVGALDAYKVDFQLLFKVARLKPDWQFVFIGAPIVDRKNKDLKRLLALENVLHLGAIDRREVPAYVQQFDVCLIPYKNNRYNAASFPLKFWEFMASGKPIIVTGAPELRAYRDVIDYVKSAKEFIAAGERALKDTKQKERQELARPHSWEKRTAKLLELLDYVIRKS